ALLLVLYPLNIKTIPLIENLSSGWAIGGFFVGGGLLYLIAIMARLFFKKDAMGGGDIKLAAFIGLYLGGYVLLALFISFALGAIVGIVMISRDKKSAKEMIPFGPFMAAGSILTIFFGPQLWLGYLSIAGLS
ncbi:A24 family peptidase, partial [Candidatus Aquicultor secundus]